MTNINQVNSNQSPNTESNRTVSVQRDESSVPQQQTGQSQTAETVAFTDTASQLQKLESTLAESPVIDTQRVEAIKQAIIDGSLQINADRVAEKMLQVESGLLG